MLVTQDEMLGTSFVCPACESEWTNDQLDDLDNEREANRDSEIL